MAADMYVVKKNKKERKSLLLRLAFLAALVYVVVVFVNQQITITQKRNMYEQITTQIADQKLVNDEIKSLTEAENMDAYVERIARETLNYVFPGETIFVDIAGN